MRSRPWVGLDMGSFSIKLLAIQSGPAGDRPFLGEVPAPPAGNDGRPAPEALAQAISRCMSDAGLPSRGHRGLTLGVSGADVIIKQISLPLLDENEVGPALRFEARKHLPFDPQSMTIDYQVLGRYPSEKRLDLLLAAVSNDRLQRLQAPLRALGLEADIVDAAPLALANALAEEHPNQREAQILLDVGHGSSLLSIYQKGEPYFTRRLDFGGRTITHAIASATHVPFDEAEEWKLAAGSDEPGFRVDWNSAEMQAVSEALRSELVDELLRTLAFYRTIGHLSEPLRLWLSGGSARLPGIAIRLADQLGMPVEIFNPLEDLLEPADDGAPRTAGPQFAQAFGLAMRTA